MIWYNATLYSGIAWIEVRCNERYNFRIIHVPVLASPFSNNESEWFDNDRPASDQKNF